MDGRRGGTARMRHAALAAAAVAAVIAGWHVHAQSVDLMAVNQASDWAAGCGTDSTGVRFCAVQKSSGSRALGYVLELRNGGVDRRIRISVDSVLIDPESPVIVQVDENEPLIWPVSYQIISDNVVSLAGHPIDVLLQELGTGHTVLVTVPQKTGEPINFELPLDGFSEAIRALEETGVSPD